MTIWKPHSLFTSLCITPDSEIIGIMWKQSYLQHHLVFSIQPYTSENVVLGKSCSGHVLACKPGCPTPSLRNIIAIYVLWSSNKCISYDPLLGIYSRDQKLYSEMNIFTFMFIVALFTIAQIWIQPKYPRTDDWIKKL